MTRKKKSASGKPRPPIQTRVDRRARQTVVTEDAPSMGLVKGDRIVALSVAEMPGVGTVAFYEALMPYVLLLDTRKDEREALSALRRAQKSCKRDAHDRMFVQNGTAIIDAQNLAARACITAFEALEAFAAEVIPDDATFTPTKGRKKGELLDREGIMWLDTKTRFGDALPSVLGGTSIKGSAELWDAFKRILDLRHAAIHPKVEHLHSFGRLDPKRLSSRILAEDFVGAAKMAEDVMEHYSPDYVKTLEHRA